MGKTNTSPMGLIDNGAAKNGGHPNKRQFATLQFQVGIAGIHLTGRHQDPPGIGTEQTDPGGQGSRPG